jgi:hypothetical protein
MFNALLFALLGGISVSCVLLVVFFGLWPLGYVAVLSAIMAGCVHFISQEEF